MGLKLARTAVGDRYVVEHMREHGFNVGGEQSGHIVLQRLRHHRRRPDRGAAGARGDRRDRARRRAKRAHLFEPLPQILKNVRFRAGAKPLEVAGGRERHSRTAKRAWATRAACSIRKSGTEPLIRVMAEGDDEKLVKTVVGDIVKVLEKACA